MYRTKEIAARVGVHPNTVRIYEEWGFISPVPRQANGYRIYSDVHLFQLKIARILFRCEIVQGDIRARARAIVYTCGKEEFAKAKTMTLEYLTHLQNEHKHALSAAEVVEKWLHGPKSASASIARTYSRKEAADILNVTAEALRNWERNGLIAVPRSDSGYRVYGEREMEQLRVIRSLRSAHYSLSAILRLLKRIEEPHSNVIEILNTPRDEEDIVYVTDRLIASLQEAMAGARAAIDLYERNTDMTISSKR